MPEADCKIVLLTGAGYSSLVGLKTLDHIIDSIGVPINDDMGILITKIWSVITGRKSNATLEDLLSALRHYSQVADLIMDDYVFREELKASVSHVMSGQFKKKWEEALAYCFRLMLKYYGPDEVQTGTDGYNLICKVLRLLSGYNKGCLHLFTTNYDCVPNVIAANTSDLNFYSHINNENGAFENQWYVITRAFLKERNPNIYLHRLHGCVGWFFDTAYPYGVREVFGTGGELTINDQNMLNQMAIKLLADEMIGNRPAFSLAFEEFRNALEQCDKVIVWGHSFRDREVIRCMINACEKREETPFQIYYIDPYMTENRAHQNMMGAVRAIPALSPAHLKFERINWVTQDGHDKLVSEISKIIQCSHKDHTAKRRKHG